VRGDYIVVFVLSVAIVAGLYWVLFRTRLGLALRATAQQPTAAQLVGISPTRSDAQAFMLTGALAGAAGMLLTMGVGTGTAELATSYTVRGLTVAVIGGLGSIPGAIVGGLLIGVVEFEALGFYGIGYRDIFAYLALFAVLVVRPQGLLGRQSA
jgi:branched-chain amino acid transport system permease protein